MEIWDRKRSSKGKDVWFCLWLILFSLLEASNSKNLNALNKSSVATSANANLSKHVSPIHRTEEHNLKQKKSKRTHTEPNETYTGKDIGKQKPSVTSTHTKTQSTHKKSNAHEDLRKITKEKHVKNSSGKNANNISKYTTKPELALGNIISTAVHNNINLNQLSYKRIYDAINAARNSSNISPKAVLGIPKVANSFMDYSKSQQFSEERDKSIVASTKTTRLSPMLQVTNYDVFNPSTTAKDFTKITEDILSKLSAKNPFATTDSTSVKTTHISPKTITPEQTQLSPVQGNLTNNFILDYFKKPKHLQRTMALNYLSNKKPILIPFKPTGTQAATSRFIDVQSTTLIPTNSKIQSNAINPTDTQRATAKSTITPIDTRINSIFSQNFSETRSTVSKPPSSLYNFFQGEENKIPTIPVNSILPSKNSISSFTNSTNDEENDNEHKNLHEKQNVIPTAVSMLPDLVQVKLDRKNVEPTTVADSTSMFETQSKEKVNSSPTRDVGINYDLMIDNQIFTDTGNQTTYILPPSLQMDLEDPEDTDGQFETFGTNKLQLTPTNDKENIVSHSTDVIDISELLKSYNTLTGGNFADQNQSQKSVDKSIKFVRLSQHSKAHCMDGSTPGYYVRKGYGDGKQKWILHLHGGAWCYDLSSCMKRRSSILGSTKHSSLEDISSFFHGILSNNAKVNPHFYNWNAAILSYCDGGLFSGGREKLLLGKGRVFYFQGREVLGAQIDDIQKRSLPNAKEIILSGTSAGGLALVLQANYIIQKLPKHAKVRGLVDAGFFLDQDSVWGDSISSLQFKSLYSLHKPVLNRKCLDSLPKKDKYKCLFPQYSLKYVKIPLYIVNSLYDHWQLSYLEGIYCVYNDKKCDTKQHDRILGFRNKMYNALNDIRKEKNGTGVFANSCLAHGQVILDYTWSRVKINNQSISEAFFDWYKDKSVDQSKFDKVHFNADCKYPCNGSCPRLLAKRCVNNFIKASEVRRKRDAELC